MIDGARRRLDALTGIRYLAALLVVLYHLAPIPHTPESGPLSAFIYTIGDGAVSFFFALSGFVLFYSNVDRAGMLKRTRRQFWVARIARIYPLYVLAFLLAAPVYIPYLVRLHPQADQWIPRVIAQAALVLLLLQSWIPRMAIIWNKPAWSLSVEALFYASFPLLVGIGRMRTRSLVLLLLGAVAASAVPTLIVGDFHGTFGRIVQAFPPLRLPEFMVGMLLGALYRRVPSGLAVNGAIAEALPVAALIGIALAGAFLPADLYRLFALPLIAVLIMSLALFRSGLSRFFGLPVMVHLGAASYGLYIIHIPLYSACFALFGRAIPEHFASWAGVGAFVVGSTLVSWLLHRWFEIPMADFVNRRLGGRGNAGREADIVSSGATAGPAKVGSNF